MKVVIQSQSPDGLNVRFKHPFLFDTWQETFEFIQLVEEAYCSIDLVKAKEKLKNYGKQSDLVIECKECGCIDNRSHCCNEHISGIHQCKFKQKLGE